MKEMRLISSGKVYRVALAQTMKDRALGMMREGMEDYDGVLLCFPFRFWWGIWQASTEDLDVFFLQKRKKGEFLIVSRMHFGRKPSFLKRWRICFSLYPVRYILELKTLSSL